MDNPKYQIFKGDDDQFYFRLRAENGEPILASEGYTQKSSCQNGIDSVKKNSPDDANYRRRGSKDGQFYFTLIALNGEVIGVSEMYSSDQARENGIAAVKRVGPSAPVEDQTA